MGRRKQMGSIYWRQDLGCWYGLVTVGNKPDGARDRRAVRGRAGDNSAKERDRVALELAGIRVQAGQGTLPRHDARTTKLAEFVPRWEADYLLRRSPITAQGYVWAIAKYVLPVLGRQALGAIGRLTVQTLLNDLHRAGKGEGTLRKVRAALSSCMRAAVEWEILPFNPVSTAQLPAPETVEDPHEEQLLSVEDGLRLLNNARGTVHYPIWLLMLGCGLRAGEACGLRWMDIDWAGREIVVRQAIKALNRDRGGLVAGVPKNRKARRVPCPAFVLSGLDELRRVRGPCPPAELVAQTRRAAPLSPRHVSNRLKIDLARLGIPHVRPHALRHSWAMLLKRQGVSREVIQSGLGHASWDTTAIYAGHINPADLAGAANELDTLFGYKIGNRESEPN